MGLVFCIEEKSQSNGRWQACGFSVALQRMGFVTLSQVFGLFVSQGSQTGSARSPPAFEQATAGVSAALSAASAELHRRAWAGAARPVACPVRTFVRLRQPSGLELMWGRRCRRLTWGEAHVTLPEVSRAQL